MACLIFDCMYHARTLEDLTRGGKAVFIRLADAEWILAVGGALVGGKCLSRYWWSNDCVLCLDDFCGLECWWFRMGWSRVSKRQKQRRWDEERTGVATVKRCRVNVEGEAWACLSGEESQQESRQ